MTAGARRATAVAPRPRLLVLRALGLGDLLAGVPALRALRRAHPGHTLVLAAPAGLRDAAAATGAVDRLLPTGAPGRAVPALSGWPAPGPELAVDLHGDGPESHAALAALRPRSLISFAAAGTRVPPWRDGEHERARWCRLLAAHHMPADPRDLRIARPEAPSPAPGAVVVHPGAAARARRWPPERYAAVVRTLRRRGHRVVVTGGPGEEKTAAEVAAAGGAPRRDVLAGDLPFPLLAALVADAACLLSGDTGPAHLAVALGTPSVTLFGPVAPERWGPPPHPRHGVIHPPGPPGDPHGDRCDPRLLRIAPQEVAAAVLRRARPEAACEPAAARHD
ncbi:glycosyltransferase family 9 protein [Streptomyces lonarensis]|uniref:Glycosyltransferase family 9 protein n=2 Tax=Streptomyces lonarensis TaxID=700599 RepID=A0A7X6CZW0_9ACTN|nr:glycosyltransferase family 9 protein [Streptomyces lonarensis]NJQ05585.1 glycosyltransferase family 9 protein [Streptomyces lonarensis]